MVLPKYGIVVAPELYHQILYAASAVKHGATNMKTILSELCIYIQKIHVMECIKQQGRSLEPYRNETIIIWLSKHVQEATTKERKTAHLFKQHMVSLLNIHVIPNCLICHLKTASVINQSISSYNSIIFYNHFPSSKHPKVLNFLEKIG